ncbi:Uncharacterized protein DAT39_001650 [Clarias magur]|uniref:Uncharacterized protein n=1 Tax=Clarias magur TaxID=1594786 RepID=A0A8J4UJN4_CLAMG|nr:Uncharacterized protein DAT39_001650 [Clarias magur]
MGDLERRALKDRAPHLQTDSPGLMRTQSEKQSSVCESAEMAMSQNRCYIKIDGFCSKKRKQECSKEMSLSCLCTTTDHFT